MRLFSSFHSGVVDQIRPRWRQKKKLCLTNLLRTTRIRRGKGADAAVREQVHQEQHQGPEGALAVFIVGLAARQEYFSLYRRTTYDRYYFYRHFHQKISRIVYGGGNNYINETND